MSNTNWLIQNCDFYKALKMGPVTDKAQTFVTNQGERHHHENAEVIKLFDNADNGAKTKKEENSLSQFGKRQLSISVKY